MANYDNETNLDGYDDLDDFIVERDDGGNAVEDDDNGLCDDDDEQDQEQPEVEEEPPIGQQEILSLRERLKADLRRRNQANGGGTGTGKASSTPVREPVRAKFGNFFGPSRPSLAPRLIEAGCSSIMREIQDASSREKRKVDLLRQNRDYADLFSDDTDVPPARKEQPTDSMLVMASKSDVEISGPMQPALKSKVPTNPPARILKYHGSIQSRVQSKSGSLRKDPLPNGKKTSAAARNGSSSLPIMKKAQSSQPSSNGRNLQGSMLIKRQAAPPAGQRQQQLPKTQRPPQPLSQSSVPQKHHLPPQSPSQVSRMNSSSVQSRNSAQKGSVQSLDRSRLAHKQPGPSIKAKEPERNAVYDDHASKKPVVKRKCSEDTEAILMIREMFHYNPQKYAGRDEDDSNMEADYRSIQMEERRSAKLGKKEDEEQLRLLEEGSVSGPRK